MLVLVLMLGSGWLSSEGASREVYGNFGTKLCEAAGYIIERHGVPHFRHGASSSAGCPAHLPWVLAETTDGGMCCWVFAGHGGVARYTGVTHIAESVRNLAGGNIFAREKV